MFISQTRLIRVQPRAEAAVYPGIVTDKEAKLAELGVQPANWGNFFLHYAVKAYLRVRVLGVITAGSRTHLVLHMKASTTPEKRDAGDYDIAESFIFARPRPTTDMRQYLRGTMRDFLVRASLQGWSGDLRDHSLRPNLTDATGFLDDSEVVLLRSADIDVDTAVA